MKNLLYLAAASAALMACQRETIVQGGNEPEVAAVDTANVVLPPSIAATKTYRCQDNSVVHIDWLSDNQSANFRTSENDTPIQLSAPTAGEPLVAEGYSLTGSASASTITLMRLDQGSQTCHV